MNETRVAVALLRRDDRVLVQQRAKGAHLEGLWEFPGGKLEEGESWEEALVREVREELGVACAVVAPFGEKTFDYPEKRVRLRFYWVALTESGVEPRATDPAVPLRWVTSRELATLPVPPANEPLLAGIAAALEGHEPEEPPASRTLGLVAWALGLLPVAFVIAALAFETIDRLYGHVGAATERVFPLQVVGGNQALFLALFLVAYALLAAWVRHVGAARRGRA